MPGMPVPPPAPLLPTPLRRYPGRACLLGEHCDWYGGSSLAVPLPMAVHAVCHPGSARLSISAEMDGRTLRYLEGATVEVSSLPVN